MAKKFSNRELLIVGVISLIGLVVLPGLNAFLPPTSPLHVDTFTLSLYGKYLTYAVLAMGVNLLWGYTGLLSLGQCVFFSLGGYALGMYLMLLIAKLGQYRADLPDFMVFLEFATKYPETSGLPKHWMPFHSFWFAAAMVVLIPALVAYIFGFLAFRSRIKGVYFSILSQALTYAMCLMFFRNDFTFGGNNGLTDFKFILGTPVLTAAEVKDAPALAVRLKTGSDPVSKFLAGQLSADSQKQLAGYSGGELSVVLKSNLVHSLNLFISTQPLYEKERFASVTLPPEVAARTGENLKDAPMLQFNRELLEAAYPREIAKKGFAGYVINAPATKRALYICSGLLLLLTYLFCRWLTSTKFGLIQRAIRDSENRVLFSGYATADFKLFVFVTAAIISALGGALFVPQVGIINPSEMSPEKSLEAVVWCAVGGRGNMLGPILGAVGLNALKSYATHAFAEQWPYILGFLFIFVTVFMPKGIIGLPEQFRELKRRWARRKESPDASAIVPATPNSVYSLSFPHGDQGRSHRPTGRRDGTIFNEHQRPPQAAWRSKSRASTRRALRTHPPRTVTAHKKEFILTLEGVSKTFEGFKAISELNFYLDEGELRVIIGPNGAGKSTMLDLITGRTKPDKGKIEFGRTTDLTRLNEYQINRLGIGRKFQTPSVYIHHTVFENLWLSLEGSRTVWSTLFSRVTPAQRDRIYDVMQTIGLTSKTDTKAGALSHGQKQWLEIGMLLAQNPKLLLVDEPAAGMTDEETHETGELLHSLESKHTIVVIEHDMTFVRQLARKVTVLHQGTMLCEGSVDEVQNNERVIEVYLGRKKKA